MHLQLFWRALSAQLFALRKLNLKTWMWSSFVFPSLAFPTLTYTEVLSDLSVFLFPFSPSLWCLSPPPTPFPQVRGQSFKRMHAPCLVSGRWGGWIERRWQGSWHLTWRLSDRRGTIRSASACHPSRTLRSRVAGKGPVNCLQMCLDACFPDKLGAGATLWWSRWSLLICISRWQFQHSSPCVGSLTPTLAFCGLFFISLLIACTFI